tara:strand:+ start:320 stop:553 length:234 start_codon:yes stop_codon:yes gene_type:complete
MIKNLKFTITSILSVIILLILASVFTIGFLTILGIFFVTRIYKKIKFKNNRNMDSNKNETKDKKEIIDIDEDKYKID